MLHGPQAHAINFLTGKNKLGIQRSRGEGKREKAHPSLNIIFRIIGSKRSEANFIETIPPYISLP
jgi:hypothetical protein